MTNIEIDPPSSPTPSDNGPHLDWLGGILAAIGLGGIISTLFLPPQFVWIGVAVGSIGIFGLIAWAVIVGKI